LIKVLIMLEGTSRLLDADFSLAELLEPYYRQMVRRRLSPRNIMRRMQRTYHDWDRFFHTLPRDLGDIIERVRKGTLDVHLAHHRLDPVINRLALGMLAAAVIVGSSQMLSSAVPPTIRGLSVIGLVGVVLGFWLAIDLLRAIRKSGGLVRKDNKPGREP
jgi:ubiquinone biosynthesis protein